MFWSLEIPFKTGFTVFVKSGCVSLNTAYVNGKCTSKPQLARSFPLASTSNDLHLFYIYVLQNVCLFVLSLHFCLEVRRFINCFLALVVSDFGINMDQFCKIGNFHGQ